MTIRSHQLVRAKASEAKPVVERSPVLCREPLYPNKCFAVNFVTFHPGFLLTILKMRMNQIPKRN
jgi:hypothetical protein